MSRCSWTPDAHPRRPGASLRKAKAMSELKEAKPKTIKVPGPDHTITIARNANRVVVKVAGRIVADTRDALILREASYAPVQYIPRKGRRHDAPRPDRSHHLLPLQGRLLLVFQYSVRWQSFHQRRVDLRSAV